MDASIYVVITVSCIGTFICGFVGGFGYACHWMRMQYEDALDRKFKP